MIAKLIQTARLSAAREELARSSRKDSTSSTAKMSWTSRVAIAKSYTSPSTDTTLATLNQSSYGEDLLFRIAIIESGDTQYLGIIENVSVETEVVRPARDMPLREVYPTVLTIRNLLSRRAGGPPSGVRNAPRPEANVYLASEEDLARFFPPRVSAPSAFLGRLRDTGYRLPLDSSILSFANTGILAGIGYGKSHLAAQLALHLHLAGRKVIIVDPTGEWPSLLEEQRDRLDKLGWRVAMTTLRYALDQDRSESFVISAIDKFRSGELTVIDASLLHHQGLAEDKIRARCELAYALQQRLMTEATQHYDRTKSAYAYNGCLFLEEAHEFIPSSPTFEIQKKLNVLFSISTKEYRKYGLGLVFIDQSLRAIHEDLQVQTYFLGTTATPGDLEFLRTRLGVHVADAVQRTRRGERTSSWVVYGLATPFPGIPWEIMSFGKVEEALDRSTVAGITSGSTDGETRGGLDVLGSSFAGESRSAQTPR
jgi:hypothetical protein